MTERTDTPQSEVEFWRNEAERFRIGQEEQKRLADKWHSELLDLMRLAEALEEGRKP